MNLKPGAVVVFTPDVVGKRMAGPGIRAYHFAQELSRHFPTTLIAQLEDFERGSESFSAVDRRNPEANRRMREARVVVGQPTRETLALNHRRQALIFDLFDPVVLELRELYGDRGTVRQRLHLRREWGRLHAALRRGAMWIAATQRQRDFYAGVHAMTDGKPTAWSEKWIEVPFGIEESVPDDLPALQPTAPLIIWGGGTWEWLDPLTAVAAVAELNRRGVACRLLFLGGSRPNRDIPQQLGSVEELRRLAASAPETVIFNDTWVPYRERGRWLRSGKIAIMLHRRTLEAEFSIRSRLFDAIWCALPVVATKGGFAADLVGGEGLGVVVEPSSVPAVAQGVEKLLRDDAFYAKSVSNLTRIRERYRWSEVTRPLVQSVRQWVG